MNFKPSDESQIQNNLPAVKTKFYRQNKNCVVDELFDFVFKTNYNAKKSRLTITIVACCGNSFDVMTEYEIPNGYGRSSSAFNSTYFEDDEPWGAKEIVVICLSCLIVFALVGVGVFLCRKHKKEQAMKMEAKAALTVQSATSKDETAEVELGIPAQTTMAPVRSHSPENSGITGMSGGNSVGQRVKLKDGRQGVLRYIGPTAYSSGLSMYGIELDEEYEGKHSGMTRGVKYFNCSVQNQGIFATADDIM